MKSVHNVLKEKRQIIRDYIRQNPQCTYKNIKRDTKLKIERIYGGMKDAYLDAKIPFSKNLKKRNIMQQKRDVIKFIQNNPHSTIPEIFKGTKVNVIRTFGSIINAYKLAGREYVHKEVSSGVMNLFVVRRCIEFEKCIIGLLKRFGEVKPKVKTSSGVADCIFTYKNKTFVVEIKDFRARNNITMSQIKQLVGYMRAPNQKNGLIVCPKESFPKRKNSKKLYISDLFIGILSEEDLRGRSINHLVNP